MHLMYVALHEVTWCIAECSSFMWHQPCQHCKYTTLVDIKNMHYKKAVHSCRITCEHSESAQERIYKSAIQKWSTTTTKILMWQKSLLVLNLDSPGPSHVGLLFATEGQKKVLSQKCLPQMPALLFITSQTHAEWQHSRSCLCDFQNISC